MIVKQLGGFQAGEPVNWIIEGGELTIKDEKVFLGDVEVEPWTFARNHSIEVLKPTSVLGNYLRSH